MGLGISYQDHALEYQQAKSSQLRRSSYNSSTRKTQQTNSTKASDNDVLSLSHNSGCTDGKDDGKIGIFSAIGNAIVGAGKGIVNAVKGCFTGKDGKFSIGKTLLTVATGAVCVAFPAVGLVACGIGAVTGGVQVAKGIGKAVTAKTDAEAKEAWQNVGSGGVTVAASVAGAKASYNAVLKSANVSYAEGTSFLTKVKNLGKDMASSTKNNFASIKESAVAVKDAIKIANLKRKVGKFEGRIGPVTEKEAALQAQLSDAEKAASATTKAILDKAPKAPTKADVTGAIKNAGSQIKKAPSNILKTVRGIKAGNFKTAITQLPAKAQTIIQALKDSSYSEVVGKYGYENVISAMETLAGYATLDQSV